MIMVTELLKGLGHLQYILYAEPSFLITGPAQPSITSIGDKDQEWREVFRKIIKDMIEKLETVLETLYRRP